MGPYRGRHSDIEKGGKAISCVVNKVGKLESSSCFKPIAIISQVLIDAINDACACAVRHKEEPSFKRDLLIINN